jgi:hypothetical protein
MSSNFYLNDIRTRPTPRSSSISKLRHLNYYVQI